MRRLGWSLFVAFVVLVPAWGVVADEKAAIERIISVGRTDNRVMEHLDFLCNRFGPRLTGSDFLPKYCATPNLTTKKRSKNARNKLKR